MLIRTVIRDCLQLNWALPEEAVPPAPAPLRYEAHPWRGGRYVFASALLFRHEGLRLGGVPGLRLSYPQFNLRFNVLDGEGVAAVLFATILVPSWVVPGARLIARQRPRPGLFDYPSLANPGDPSTLSWSVRRRRALEVRARPGMPGSSEGPCLGDWKATVRHFRRRELGYFRVRDGLRQIEATYRSVEAQPVAAEILRHGLLSEALSSSSAEWPALHSSWICSQIPCVFEWGHLPAPTLRRSAPAPG